MKTLLLLLSFACSMAVAFGDEKPNILVFLVDDMGLDDAETKRDLAAKLRADSPWAGRLNLN